MEKVKLANRCIVCDGQANIWHSNIKTEEVVVGFCHKCSRIDTSIEQDCDDNYLSDVRETDIPHGWTAIRRGGSFNVVDMPTGQVHTPDSDKRVSEVTVKL